MTCILLTGSSRGIGAAAKAALEASVRYLAADLGGKNIRVNAISALPSVRSRNPT